MPCVPPAPWIRHCLTRCTLFYHRQKLDLENMRHLNFSMYQSCKNNYHFMQWRRKQAVGPPAKIFVHFAMATKNMFASKNLNVKFPVGDTPCRGLYFALTDSIKLNFSYGHLKNIYNQRLQAGTT